MYVIKDNTFNISVRNLVEFMCLGGDIDNNRDCMAQLNHSFLTRIILQE